MKFGAVPVQDALGAILAHGVPAASLSKGIVLGEGHIAALQALGLQEVTVARLEDGDIGEDEAATRLAKTLVPDEAGQKLRLTKAKAGRVNIMAHGAGLVRLDVARINALNQVDPMITLATVPHLKRVTAGMMLGTIKIISYGVSGDSLARACAEVERLPEGQLHPFAMSIQGAHLKTATLIETLHAGQRPAPKGRRVLDERLDRLGSDLIETLHVPHEEGAIAEAIGRARGQVIFILTASATSDPNDTAPAGLRRAGGKMLHYGMPVDPGNLLFLGTYAGSPVGAFMGERPVIGLPGCARSPALNGADWVMERVICGFPVTSEDISAMGVGGLLKEIPERGLAR